MVAYQHCKTNVVTVSLENLDFISQVKCIHCDRSLPDWQNQPSLIRQSLLFLLSRLYIYTDSRVGLQVLKCILRLILLINHCLYVDVHFALLVGHCRYALVGDVVAVSARINFTSSRSMELQVAAHAEGRSGALHCCASGLFNFVSLDEAGRLVTNDP